MYALTELDMNDNHITSILDNSFDECDHLVTLDLGFNDITAIETDSFKGLDNLERLILARKYTFVHSEGTV